MFLSIIIPTYNNNQTLKQTLDCVRAQIDSQTEIIVVNDGGADPRKLMDLDDEQIKVLDLDRNLGVSSARNIGLSVAKGEIVYFLDSDDCIALGILKEAKRAFSDERIHALVFGKKTYREKELHEIIPVPERVNTISPPIELTPEEFCRIFLRAHGPFIPSVTYLRKSWLLQNFGDKPWEESLSRAEDTLFFLRLANAGSIHLSRTLGVTYRVRKTSLTNIDPILPWSERLKASNLFLSYDSSACLNPKVRYCAWRMRQNAVRRLARSLAHNGQRREAFRLALQYLWTPLDIRMVAELPRLASTYLRSHGK